MPVARRSVGAAGANSSPIAIIAGRCVRPKGSVVAGSFIASGACLIGISRAPIQKNPSQETAFVCLSATRTKLPSYRGLDSSDLGRRLDSLHEAEIARRGDAPSNGSGADGDGPAAKDPAKKAWLIPSHGCLGISRWQSRAAIGSAGILRGGDVDRDCRSRAVVGVAVLRGDIHGTGEGGAARV